jgi:hypothetical protein
MNLNKTREVGQQEEQMNPWSGIKKVHIDYADLNYMVG